MILISFLFTVIGIPVFIISLIALLYRIVSSGGWQSNDALTSFVIKMGILGLAMGLLGQVIAGLAL